MAEGKEKKKKSSATANAAADVQRMQNMTSGEMLRMARTDKKLGLEEVSSAIHIRVAQLRAIEEGNVEALPGMTYATGFVRSYATYLKINSAEVVNKFKTEHGAMKPPMHELYIPDPIRENRMPDPMIVGVTAFAAIVLLLLWTFLSGGDDEAVDITSQIPPAPVTETAALSPFAVVPSVVLPETAERPVASPVHETPPVIADAPVAALPAPSPVIVPSPKPPITPTKEVIEQAPPPPPQEEIVIKSGKGRVVIRAKETSWIQVDNAQQQTLIKKLLKPGEQFFVPSEPGMTLVTTNAGGIEIMVDGVLAPSIGRKGEIVRGLSLEPSRLTRKRQRVNQY